jgi:hypothetical protein
MIVTMASSGGFILYFIPLKEHPEGFTVFFSDIIKDFLYCYDS